MAFTNPERNIERLNIGEDFKVADIGSGAGHYVFLLAKKLPFGKVYAVDVQRNLLEKIRTEANRERLSNIETVWSDAEEKHGIKLNDESMDIVVASNILFQIFHKEGFIREVKRILKMRGKVLLVDWSDSFGGLGPKPDDVVKDSKAKELFKEENFKEVLSFDAGDHHYGIIFEKQ